MPMSTTERATIAGRARQAQLTPQERREQMRKVRLAAAVKAIVADWPDLSPEQTSKLCRIFGGTRDGK